MDDMQDEEQEKNHDSNKKSTHCSPSRDQPEVRKKGIKREHNSNGVKSEDGFDPDMSLLIQGSFWTSLIHPDFEELSSHFPEFRQAYRQLQKEQQRASLPFAACITQEFSVALTKGLLRTLWGLSLTDIPLHNLCPPIPNRFFLIDWLQHSLLPCLTTPSCHNYFVSPPRTLGFHGLDIGTGATCIYPLLFVGSWRRTSTFATADFKIWASDVDPEAIQCAQANVHNNRLQNFIQPILVPPSSSQQNSYNNNNNNIDDAQYRGPYYQSIATIFNGPDSAKSCGILDFCITNPPFYSNDEERLLVRQGDSRSRTPMTGNEGTYPGGEIGFCSDILYDQCVLAGQRQPLPGWTVVMCGKKTSLVALHSMLTQILGFSHVRTAEFGPGHLTRWFLAWTWQWQPLATSPWAVRDSFDFSISPPKDEPEIVVQRLLQFGKDFSLSTKTTTISSGNNNNNNRDGCHHVEFWQDEDSGVDIMGEWVADDNKHLPDRLARACWKLVSSGLRRDLLPSTGHFLLTATILLPSSDQFPSNKVVIQVNAFAHTPYGKRVVSKLKQQMPGEIGRTNRKWRRLGRQALSTNEAQPSIED